MLAYFTSESYFSHNLEHKANIKAYHGTIEKIITNQDFKIKTNVHTCGIRTQDASQFYGDLASALLILPPRPVPINMLQKLTLFSNMPELKVVGSNPVGRQNRA